MPRVNSKALTILCLDDEIYNSPVTQRFIEKGHVVHRFMEPGVVYDVIIGPRCWRIDPLIKLGDDYTVEESLERQLEIMEKGVRAIKYPKEKKDAQKETHP